MDKSSQRIYIIIAVLWIVSLLSSVSQMWHSAQVNSQIRSQFHKLEEQLQTDNNVCKKLSGALFSEDGYNVEVIIEE